MSKQKTTRSLTIEIEPETFEAVKKYADSDDRSMSYITRKALKAFLASLEFDNGKISAGVLGDASPLAASTRSPEGGKR